MSIRGRLSRCLCHDKCQESVELKVVTQELLGVGRMNDLEEEKVLLEDL